MFDDHVAELRGQGALGWLPYAQEPLALGLLVTSRFRDAECSTTHGSTGWPPHRRPGRSRSPT